VCNTSTLGIDGVTVIVIAAVMVSEAVPIFVASSAETAVIVTEAGFGIALGAVKRPEAEIVPRLLLPPVIPLTCQVTAVFVVLATVAVNCTVPPISTELDEGLTPTVMTGGGGGGGGLPPQKAQSDVKAKATMVRTLAGGNSILNSSPTLSKCQRDPYMNPK
jgi:hypothetical protein